MAEYLCPHCKNPVYDDEALLCLYCGDSLRRSVGFMGGLKYATPRIFLVIVVLLVLLSFVVLVSL